MQHSTQRPLWKVTVALGVGMMFQRQGGVFLGKEGTVQIQEGDRDGRTSFCCMLTPVPGLKALHRAGVDPSNPTEQAGVLHRVSEQMFHIPWRPLACSHPTLNTA